MSQKLNPQIEKITKRIIKRSADTRRNYLDRVYIRRPKDFARKRLQAGNQAHAYAGCPLADKTALLGDGWPNIGIISAYNDMLSAHKPYEKYPEIIRKAARKYGATAQVAGGVPAMCDGITQGEDGMELSLFSRDVIAMSTAIALSHNVFDVALYLGVCDKIVPGLLIGALQFGHLPGIFVPAGPMPSGLPNKQKVKTRQEFAEGKIGKQELLKAEMQSYHSPGTCTFYGTANSNQMLMEIMGLHMPGAAFINPSSPLREKLTIAATKRASQITIKSDYTPLGKIISEKTIVNAIVALMATGGSTNLVLHLPAIAKSAGIILRWEDFADISAITPLIAHIYPNGDADINQFHKAGGVGFVVRELLSAGLLHEDVNTIVGFGLHNYCKQAFLQNDDLVWRNTHAESKDLAVLRPVSKPFAQEGGLRLLQGSLGRGVIKTSAIKKEHYEITAPAIVFDNQSEVIKAFEQGKLNRDFIAVVRFQGPRANGMPELHKLMPVLGVLQDKGFKVALVTDGRLSGASGKIAAAIHITPEAIKGGAMARIQDGDIITLNANTGRLDIDVNMKEFSARNSSNPKTNYSPADFGRELFSGFRLTCSSAEMGACSIFGSEQNTND